VSIAMSESVNELVGTWTLLSVVMEDIESKEQVLLWGERPSGRLVVTPGGYWIVVQTAEGRGVPESDEECVAAFRSLLAYSGRCRIAGGKVIIKIDMAWDESWTGTEQIRFFRLDGDRLFIASEPQRFAGLNGKVLIGRLTWMRTE
jgi:Lipocalin-like domain